MNAKSDHAPRARVVVGADESRRAPAERRRVAGRNDSEIETVNPARVIPRFATAGAALLFPQTARPQLSAKPNAADCVLSHGKFVGMT
jgi:hypothetical protein